MNNGDEQNFFDARTIAAVALVGLTFIGWQWYMQQKYPEAMAKKSPPVVTETVKVQDKSATSPTVMATDAQANKEPTLSAAKIAESVIAYKSDTLNFEISNRGMGLKNIQANKFNDRKGKPIQLGYPEEGVMSFETRLLGSQEPLVFALEKVNENLFVGRATVGKLKIAKTLEVHPEKYVLDYKIQVSGEDDRFVGITNYLTELVDIPQDQSFFLPQFQIQEFFLATTDGEERVIFSKEDLTKSWSKVRIASIGSHYFTQAILDKSPVLAEAKGRLDHRIHFAEMSMQYTVLNKGEPFNLEYQAFIGPKSHQLLMNVDPALAKVVDFGFFNWIGRHILMLLKWFFSVTGNWGWSIILLTIVVRLMVLPFNIYSYKSMKAMQAIQPQIKSLRERYKDDQQKQQQEMMALMKEHKVNPLGGCLPVFLQFPIFIALYQVLGNSVELYQAPFALWIHDLSLKDPFYILPVLMGVTMFIQQKITPNTMDPAQAKVMLFMPLLFTFFMVSLPSGLTLYMWVGALFSVLQQMYFMRDGSGVGTPAQVK